MGGQIRPSGQSVTGLVQNLYCEADVVLPRPKCWDVAGVERFEVQTILLEIFIKSTSGEIELEFKIL